MNSYRIDEDSRMISTEHTQSLSDFRQKAGETLDRLNQTGQAEILTVNGEARAVLLSPAAYDELAREALLARDTSVIRRAIQQLNEGNGQDAEAFFDGVRAQLIAMKADQAMG
jgi:prevent-host-death family protein